ncbi:hypothetical protein PIROE2DRAFT_1393 [Piromyces sp. E2]|nr:hypothetical protein PIROE2DRAFT_1393 [Piromyces sp. E2]|eukprot:OUM70516.1 hypothetical protein PIROE2DRAFT_1393 [Piromyces sp. E2]
MAVIKLSEHFTYFKLLRFTLPTIIMMIFTSLYCVVDGIFISNCLGSDAFAAVSIVWPINLIYSTIGFMIGIGGGALISKTLGEGKKYLAKRYFSMFIYFDILSGIFFSILGYFTVRPITKLLGAEGDVLEFGVLYGKILFIPLTLCILQNSFQSFFIVAERPKLGLIVSVIAGLTNIVGDFIFVYLCDIGIKGPAIATGISQCVGAILPILYFMIDNDTHLRLEFTKLEFKPIFKACVNGLSEMMIFISVSVVTMLYNYQLLRIKGSDGVIAYGVISYSNYIFVNIFSGYSDGSSPIVSFHFGAKNTDELENLLKKSLIIISTASIVIFGISEGLADVFAIIFVRNDNALFRLTIRAIRIYSIAYIIMGYNVYISSFFTGLNNGIISAIIAMFRTIICQVIMIFVLPLLFDIDGVWMAISFAEGITLFVSLYFIISNRKKYKYY